MWQQVLEKMKRWVTQYLVHVGRLASNKPDASVTEEMARRFAVDVVEDRDGYSEALRCHPDLEGASQEDIKSLVEIFETWRADTLGDVDMENLGRYNPRFCDFLVIDEGSLRSLAALPEETPHLGPVSRAERMVGAVPPGLQAGLASDAIDRPGTRCTRMPTSGSWTHAPRNVSRASRARWTTTDA